jgi:murein DD-endopeptidase MepM/ murein hydrolase activator NlpD
MADGETRGLKTLLSLGGLLCLGVVFFQLHGSGEATRVSATLVSPAPAVPAAASSPEPARPMRELTLRSGQTLSDVLAALGLDVYDSNLAVQELSRYLDARRLRPGHRFRGFLGAGDGVAEIEVALEGRGEVRLARDGAGWRSSFRPVERSERFRFIKGELRDGLEAAVREAGGDTALTYEMASVLQWDIDFNRDLRVGDRFDVLFSEILVDGRPSGSGDIVALSYENGGRRMEAYRRGDGYFDSAGQPMRKMFLKSPLKYSRVTSRFTQRRFHPVLKIYRPHYGVDYGAPTGTAAYVTAAGVVSWVGWDGGGGRTVKVRHPNGFMTAYLHLSKFPSGLRVGSRVRQGDVIGYVGSTGLATASHLDYRVQQHGRWIDPLRIANQRAEPLGRAELASFRSWAGALRADLDAGRLPHASAPRASGAMVAVLAASSSATGSGLSAPVAVDSALAARR